MKKRANSITFQVDGIDHIIDLEYNVTGIKSIKYDKETDVSFIKNVIVSIEEFYTFEFNNHIYDLKIPWKFNGRFELFIDGKSTETGRGMEDVILRHDLMLSSFMLLCGGLMLLLSASEMSKFNWIYYIMGAVNVLLSVGIFKKFKSKVFMHSSSILLIITGVLFFLERDIANTFIIFLLSITYVAFGLQFLYYHIKSSVKK